MFAFNAIKHFIKRFISSFVILLLLDIITFVTPGYQRTQEISATDTINQVAQNLSFDNSVTSGNEGKEIIKQDSLWVMVTDSENGNQVFHYGTLKTLKKHYDLADVTQFSRFYLDDYPVFTHAIDSNLIAIGFPEDRIFKFPSNYYEKSYIAYICWLIFGIIAANIIYFIDLYFYSTHFISKRLQSATQAIIRLPRGLDTNLEKQDDFQKLIDAINQADKELKDNRIFREKWTPGIAHDVKTSLSVIASSASLAKNKPDDTEVRRHTEPISVEGYYIQNILNDLNIFARLTDSQFQLRKEAVRLVPFFKEVIIQIINQGIWENFQFDFGYDEGLAEKNVLSEPNLILCVIHNVIYNLVLHNLNGCQASTCLHDRGDFFHVTTRDNGVSVSCSEPANLYQQEDTEFDTAGVHCHNMGSKITRQIVQVHEEKLAIGSELNHYF